MFHVLWMTAGFLAGVLIVDGRRALAVLVALWLGIAAAVLLLARPSFPLIDSVGILSTLGIGILALAAGHQVRQRARDLRLRFLRR